MTDHETVAVHVWPDGEFRNGAPMYSVSDVDDEGGEIHLIASGLRGARAWNIGCDRAEFLGVKCIELGHDGQAVDRYDPPTDEITGTEE